MRKGPAFDSCHSQTKIKRRSLSYIDLLLAKNLL
jgi:hypothetical protein